MKYIIWVFSIFLMLIIQGGVLMPLNLELTNLPLLLIVVSLLFSEFDFAMFLTLTAGIMLDFLSGSSGAVLVSLVSSFMIMYFVVNRVLDREPTLPILFSVVACGTAGYFLIYLGVTQALGWFGGSTSINIRSFFFLDLPKSLALNLIFTYPVFQFYSLIEYLSQKFLKHGPKSI